MELRYVKYLWDDKTAEGLSGLDRLVYRSNKLGEDLTLTNTGGGNTSAKLIEKDPLTNENVRCSGSKSARSPNSKRDGFASLYLDKVRAMKSLYLERSASRTQDWNRGPDVPDVQPLRIRPEPAACSIDTPLHTFNSFQHIDHLHPNAVIAIATRESERALHRDIR
jgi:rhamnose utilization protein RhaD (predicted bifunctional aldolase and dehydrogenase)